MKTENKLIEISMTHTDGQLLNWIHNLMAYLRSTHRVGLNILVLASCSCGVAEDWRGVGGWKLEGSCKSALEWCLHNSVLVVLWRKWAAEKAEDNKPFEFDADDVEAEAGKHLGV